jgi:hypothetical protein
MYSFTLHIKIHAVGTSQGWQGWENNKNGARIWQMGSVLHRYGYTRGFLAGFSQGMGMGTENLNPP